jgi:hypothetical protein
LALLTQAGKVPLGIAHRGAASVKDNACSKINFTASARNSGVSLCLGSLSFLLNPLSLTDQACPFFSGYSESGFFRNVVHNKLYFIELTEDTFNPAYA